MSRNGYSGRGQENPSFENAAFCLVRFCPHRLLEIISRAERAPALKAMADGDDRSLNIAEELYRLPSALNVEYDHEAHCSVGFSALAGTHVGRRRRSELHSLFSARAYRIAGRKIGPASRKSNAGYGL